MSSAIQNHQCRFCELIRDNNIFLYRDDLVSVFLDKDPISKGHILLIPNEHYLDLDEIPKATLSRLMRLMQEYIRIMKSESHIPGYSIMQNGGIYNDIGHFHFHLFPRRNAEEFGWTYSENNLPQLDNTEKSRVTEQLQLAMGMKSMMFPLLKSNRLILNELQYDDVENIVRFVRDEELSSMTLNIPFPYSKSDATSWITRSRISFKEKSKIPFAIRYLDGNLIGSIALHLNQRFNRANVGYWIGKPYWNQGIASEALTLVLDYAFNKLKLNKIIGQHLLANSSSGKVMIKNGMIKEGILKEHSKKGKAFRDVVQYRITKSEYQSVQP